MQCLAKNSGQLTLTLGQQIRSRIGRSRRLGDPGGFFDFQALDLLAHLQRFGEHRGQLQFAFGEDPGMLGLGGRRRVSRSSGGNRPAQRLVFPAGRFEIGLDSPHSGFLLQGLFAHRVTQGLHQTMLRLVDECNSLLSLPADFRHARIILGMGGPQVGVFISKAFKRFAFPLHAHLQLLKTGILGQNSLFERYSLFFGISTATSVYTGPIRSHADPRDKEAEYEARSYGHREPRLFQNCLHGTRPGVLKSSAGFWEKIRVKY